MSEFIWFQFHGWPEGRWCHPRSWCRYVGLCLHGQGARQCLFEDPAHDVPAPGDPQTFGRGWPQPEAVKAAAARFGYERAYTDWREMLKDDRIQLFDNGGPNNIHAEPCIAAAQAGKHILCEKPLGRNAKESAAMLEAAEKAGVKHAVAYNYRFVPAIRQIREIIEIWCLGQIYHFRAMYLQEWVLPHYNVGHIWRLDKDVAGCGALGDLGAHLIDIAHFLVGDFKSVSAMTKTFIPERLGADGEMKKIELEDAFVSVIEFENGAIGTLEATRFAAGRKNANVFEINGEKGSIRFDLERMNEMQVFWVNGGPKETQGFVNVLVSEPFHPFWSNWWPQGHIIGWEHTFVHEITHLLDAIVNDKPVSPYGADFMDGYKNAVVCDAILASAAGERRMKVAY